MSKLNRRDFLKTTGMIVAAGSFVTSPFAIGGSVKKVVVVGGGMGGATAAKYLRIMDPSIEVTLIEANKDYFTCFASNEVISGSREMSSIKFGYEGLKKHGVNMVFDVVTNIDANKQVITTAKGSRFAYDRCIVSPGIDFKYEYIEGYDAEVAQKIPHAWKAGYQTVLLRKQLVAMKDGGLVVIAPPTNPFRCPPGPYERISQIAHYLKTTKPKSKIIILDPKDKFSKFGLFTSAWKKYYGYGTDNSMIDWINGAQGGAVEIVDADTMTVSAEFDNYKADVINIIPAQKAGKIAFAAGLTKGDWCPIVGNTFESTIHKNIHVIGDSSVASPLPKSGYAANSEGKVCAAAIVALLNDKDIPDPSFVNTCYSVLAPNDGISVAMVYQYKNGKIIKAKGSGGLTSSKFNKDLRAREVRYGHTWFHNITNDTFG